MLRFLSVVTILALSGCMQPAGHAGRSQAIVLPPSGSGSIRSLRANWNIKAISEACINYAENGALPTSLGSLGFKASRRQGGVLFSISSERRNDRIEVLMVPHGDGHKCQTTHRTFGGFGSSGLVFDVHNALNQLGWTQIDPAPQGVHSLVGDGFWLKDKTGILKRVDRRPSGTDSTGDQGFVIKITLIGTEGKPA